MVIKFWVYEHRRTWLFQDFVETIEDLIRVAERIDNISRLAYYFEPENLSLSPEERDILERLLREVKSEKSTLLLAEML